MSTIALTSGLAYQDFSTTVNGTRLRFQLRWLTRYQYYSVNIYDTDGEPVALGRALHAGVNLLSGLNLNIGAIALEGEPATLDNLGIKNTLNWTVD